MTRHRLSQCHETESQPERAECPDRRAGRGDDRGGRPSSVRVWRTSHPAWSAAGGRPTGGPFDWCSNLHEKQIDHADSRPPRNQRHYIRHHGAGLLVAGIAIAPGTAHAGSNPGRLVVRRPGLCRWPLRADRSGVPLEQQLGLGGQVPPSRRRAAGLRPGPAAPGRSLRVPAHDDAVAFVYVRRGKTAPQRPGADGIVVATVMPRPESGRI